jgi:predicted NUDIX family NTP pyrophosphohydrolase
MAALKKGPARSNVSASILAYRRGRRGLEVLLVHPGGPFWRNKDDGAWSIPKGEIGASEDPEMAARRGFAEELGPAASTGSLQALGEVRQRGGKRVIAFCGEADFDKASLSSNTFEMEWPPRAVGARPFRRSIAPSGSTWRPHDRRSCPGRSSSSIGSPERCHDRIWNLREPGGYRRWVERSHGTYGSFGIRRGYRFGLNAS